VKEERLMTGETLPVEPKRVDPPEKQPKGQWGLWLALSLLVIALLFCVGQLALISPADIQAADTHSGLKADYSLWPPLSFKPLEEALVEDLISENPTLPTQIVVSGNYWPTSSLPAVPTQTPSATPTELPTPTASLRPARLPATPVSRPPITQPAVASAPAPTATRPVVTNTQAPTATNRPGNPYRSPTPTRTPTVTLTKTPTATFTQTATASLTPTKTLTRTVRPPATRTYTPSATSTSTGTATDTPTFTPTPTVTDTPTPTSTSTSTHTPTSNPTASTPTPVPLPTGVNFGPPDFYYHNIMCGTSVVIDLGAPTQIGTLIFYEFINEMGCHGGICLDWVVLDLGNAPAEPWSRRIFYWGDTNNDNNGSLPSTYYPPEISNQAIYPANLYHNWGIQIHVDGVYRYLRVSAPSTAEGCSDPAQVDSIEIWTATLTPTPTP
jgi:hypothetical protein